MGIVVADYDDDGDGDVLVCNDAMANFLFRNDGTGKFTEVALTAGFAYNLDGNDNGNMGIDCGDFDNDGRIDFYTTTFAAELPVLYRNAGGGFLEDVTLVTGAGAGKSGGDGSRTKPSVTCAPAVIVIPGTPFLQEPTFVLRAKIRP